MWITYKRSILGVIKGNIGLIRLKIMAEINEITGAKPKKTKVKMMLPAIVLVTSFYYSLSFTWGIVVGYLLCRAFCNLFVKNGKIDSIFIDYGKWSLHLHHWIMGVAILAAAWVIDYFYLPAFFAGTICGMIIQDIYDYNDWHKVIVKNTDSPEQKTA